MHTADSHDSWNVAAGIHIVNNSAPKYYLEVVRTQEGINY